MATPRFSADIKNKIVTILAALKTGGTIGTYLFDDLAPNPLTMDFGSFPAVVVGMPSMESDYETNRGNLRVYEYPLMIVCRPEDYQSNTHGYEDLVDDITYAFDNAPTLSGEADGGVAAAFTRPSPINSGDKTYIVTFVILRAKAYVDLSF